MKILTVFRFLSRDFKFVFNFEIIDHTNQMDMEIDDDSNQKAPVVVKAVSNGLLLSTSTQFFHDCYYIINPYTHQYSALPKPLRIYKSVVVGFIVEPIDGSFKVVRIGGYEGKSNALNFEVYSSKTGEWKDKTASFNIPVQFFTSSASFTRMYLVACQRIFYLMEYGWRLIVFGSKQVTKNDIIQCLVIDLPAHQEINHQMAPGMIGECQDKNVLHYCQVTDKPLVQKLRVWELRKTEEKEHYWCFLHEIRVDKLIMSIPENIRAVAVDAMDPDIVYLLSQRTMVFSEVNLRTRVLKRLFVFKSIIYPWTIFQYVLPPWPTPILHLRPDYP